MADARPPSPELFLDTVRAYQRTAALKGALDLALFTAIGNGKETAERLAQRCGASGRGMRILCDYLTILGFLTKEDDGYSLTPESAMFLDRISPPDAAAFSLVMLCSTPSGDAYTFPELDRMFRNAGFARNELHALPPSPHQVIISSK